MCVGSGGLRCGLCVRFEVGIFDVKVFVYEWLYFAGYVSRHSRGAPCS